MDIIENSILIEFFEQNRHWHYDDESQILFLPSYMDAKDMSKVLPVPHIITVDTVTLETEVIR